MNDVVYHYSCSEIGELLFSNRCFVLSWLYLYRINIVSPNKSCASLTLFGFVSADAFFSFVYFNIFVIVFFVFWQMLGHSF